MRACEAVRARRGEAGARSSRAVQAACEPHARSGTATAAGSRWPRRNARTMGSSRRRASLTRHAGHFSTAGVRRDGATARPRHRSAENDVGDDGDGGHDSCAAIARRSDDDGTREQSAPPFFSSTACRRLRQPAHLRKIAARMWWMCVMRASIDRVAATRRLRPSSSRTAGRSGLREQTLAKSNWGSLLLVGGSRSNRPIKKRGEMDRWEEESVQTTHKEKR